MRTIKRIISLLIFATFSTSLVAAELKDGISAFNAKKYDVAFPILLESAVGGSSYAQGLIALLYIDGIGAPKNYSEAFRWANLGAQKNDLNSLYVLGLINQYGLDRPPNAVDAINYFSKSADLGNIVALFNMGQIYAFSSDLSYRNFNDAVKFLNQSLDKGHKPANRSLGILYSIGSGDIGPNPEKALPYLEAAYKLDPNDKLVKKLLVEAYSSIVLGDGRYRNVTKTQQEKAQIFIKELVDKDDPYWYYYGIKDAWGGYKRPFNKQLALELTMLGIKKSDKDLNQDLIRQAWLLFNDKPFKENRYLHFAWFYKNFQESKVLEQQLNAPSKKYFDEAEKQMKSELNPSEIAEIQQIKLNDLADKSLTYLAERKKLIGNVEPTDYLGEGWKVFNGKDRPINEPLGQHLTEESLRLAIRIKDQETINEARNNLGVMLVSAVNPNVRNERLALIHLMDGVDSSYGPSNILWWDYRGRVQISNIERQALRERYKKQTNSDHPTISLAPLTEAQKTDPRELDKLIQSKETSNNDPVLANALAQYYEQQISVFGLDKAIDSYKAAHAITELSMKMDPNNPIPYMRMIDDSEVKIKKLTRVKAGDYEKGVPDTVVQISEIFKDIETVRGVGKSNESVASRSTSVIQGSKKMNLNALVIGNSNYKINQLNNSVNDANSIADKLKKYGFFVTIANNLDRKSFIKTLLDFSEKAKDSDVTVLFYGGHGVQLGGQNYLLPIDIDLNGTEEVVTYDGISLNEILRRNIPGKSKVVFLDACRTKPFKSSVTRGSSDGLAPMNVATGTLISFATRDGGVAYDGAGSPNSPYTTALVKLMDKDDDIALLLREVRDEVMAKTNGKQEPWEYGALSGGRLVISRLSK